jgi:hypothetical protein
LNPEYVPDSTIRLSNYFCKQHTRRSYNPTINLWN